MHGAEKHAPAIEDADGMREQGEPLIPRDRFGTMDRPEEARGQGRCRSVLEWDDDRERLEPQSIVAARAGRTCSGNAMCEYVF